MQPRQIYLSYLVGLTYYSKNTLVIIFADSTMFRLKFTPIYYKWTKFLKAKRVAADSRIAVFKEVDLWHRIMDRKLRKCVVLAKC